MHTVSIETLANELTKYVRLAAGGEIVLITEHDRVVAELRPSSHDLEELPAADHPEERRVSKPQSGATGAPPRGKLDMTLDELMADLDESREDRF
jgi:antitoxin (DNA-binding transcriptional repressor) of toxin-antitoxin stability system